MIGCTKDLNYDLFANANYKEGTMPYVEMKKKLNQGLLIMINAVFFTIYLWYLHSCTVFAKVDYADYLFADNR